MCQAVSFDSSVQLNLKTRYVNQRVRESSNPLKSLFSRLEYKAIISLRAILYFILY